MSSSDPLVHLWRFMTHVNAGATLGMVAWLAWSGWQVVTGRLTVMRDDPGTVRVHELPRSVDAEGRLLLLRSGTGAPPCQAPAAAAGDGAMETDL